MSEQTREFNSFKEFYPFYLAEHQNPVNRALHFIGSLLSILVLIGVVVTQYWWGLFILPVIGYGFAWLGHFVFERNKPATFKHPFYSLIGDWLMFWQVLTRFHL